MQGYVSCNCFWSRLAKPHPHPASLEQPAPGVLLLSPRSTEKVQSDHEEWLYDACSHPFMQVAWEDLGEPREKQLLITALEPVPGKVPLIDAITRATTPPGPWTPDQVQEATRELEWIRRDLPPFKVQEVRDAETEELLVETVGEEVYVTTGEGMQLGVNARGIWMAKRGVDVFNTRVLEQEEKPDGSYRLTPESGPSVASSAAFTPYDAENPDRHRSTPRRVLHVSADRRAPSLERHLEPLDKLLKAARKTKHSIIWIP